MFSQWRGKRHYPFAVADPITTTAPQDSSANGGDSLRRANQKHPHRAHTKMAGFRTKGVAAIGGKGNGRNRGLKDGSVGSQPEYDFAAGPRSSSRGAKSLEFGGGVVPDARSESQEQELEGLQPSRKVKRSPPMAVIGFEPTPSSPSSLAPQTSSDSGSKVNYAPSMDSPDVELFSPADLQDLRAILTLTTSPFSDDTESPSMSETSNFTTPETLHGSDASWSQHRRNGSSTTSHSRRVLGPAIPLRKTSSNVGGAGQQVVRHQKKRSLAEALATLGAPLPPPQPADDPTVPPPAAEKSRPLAHGQKDSTSSFLETVSRTSSGQLESRESRRSSAAPGSHDGSLGPSNQETQPSLGLNDRMRGHGLGIFGGEDSPLEETRRSSRFKGSSISSAATESLHRKSESLSSALSSADSLGRSTRYVDASRHFADDIDDKSASCVDRLPGGTMIGESESSVGAAETSAELVELGPLRTIKEKAEESQVDLPSAEAAGTARAGPYSGLDSRSSGPAGAPWANKDFEDSTSPSHNAFTPSALHGIAAAQAATRGPPVSPAISRKLPSTIAGIGSPTFGCSPGHSRTTRSKQSSISVSEASASVIAEGSATPTACAFAANATAAPACGSADLPSNDPSSKELLADTPDSSRVEGAIGEPRSTTVPLPSAPFSGSMLSTPDAATGRAFSSLPPSPIPGGCNGQIKAGIRRKAKPAALTLSKSASNLNALTKSASNLSGPLSASAMSPGTFLRGAPSPTRSRALPPSAPPPDEPLPPLPPTPSLIGPRSPLIRSRKSSAATPPRFPSSNVPSTPHADAPPTPTLAKHVPSSPALATFASSPAIAGGNRTDKTFAFPASASIQEDSNSRNIPKSSHRTQQSLSSPLDQLRSDLLNTKVCSVGYSSSTEELGDSSSFEPQRDPFRSAVPRKTQDPVSTPTTDGRTSAASLESGDGTLDGEAHVAVVTTITRVPSTAVRMAVLRNQAVKEPIDAENVPSKPLVAPSLRPPIETGASTSTVQRMTARFESHAAQRDKPVASKPLQPVQAAQPVPVSQIASLRQSSAPPSAWTKKFQAPYVHSQNASVDSSTAEDFEQAPRATTDLGHERLTDSALELREGLKRRASVGSMRDRRLEMDQDKVDLAEASSEEAKAHILKRTEGRFMDAFGEIAFAFKQLLSEKRMLEQLVREVTPLDGLGQNGQGLGEYIVDMNARLDSNAVEIRKLLDLLDQQRDIIDKMLETHQIEVNSYLNEIDYLHQALDEARDQADMHMANAVRFNEELDQAQQETVAAKSEAMRLRDGVRDESSKRDKISKLLLGSRDKLQTVEAENALHRGTIEALEAARSEEQARYEAEISLLSATLAKAGLSVPLGSQTSRRNSSPDFAKHGEIKFEEESHGETLARSATAEAEESSVRLASPRSSSAETTMTMTTTTTSSSSRSDLEVDAVIRLRRENAELKKLVEERDAELVQARLGSADGAVEWSDDASSHLPSSEAAVEPTSTTEIKRLRAQIAEQRTRETQIRTAYKILREELRKTQTGFLSERRRNSGFGLIGQGGALANPLISASGGRVSSAAVHQDSDTSPTGAQDKRWSRTSVQLKRLSLPLAADPSSLFNLRTPYHVPDPTGDGGLTPPSSAAAARPSTALSGPQPGRTAPFRHCSEYGFPNLVAAKRPAAALRGGIPIISSSTAAENVQPVDIEP